MCVYNSNDLLVRRVVAANGIVQLALQAVSNARAGSLDSCKQKMLELAIAQFECIKCHKELALPAMGIFKPLGNSELEEKELATLSVNGIVISNNFVFANNKITTSQNIVKAIESFTSIPEYSAVVVGDEVHIQSILKGVLSNGYSITINSASATLTHEFTHFFGGQEGVTPGDNVLSDALMDKIFNNIAEITGCGYAPLGTNYINA